LARDLHDAISQTLFSVSLTAEVLPRLWERNPEAGKQKLEELKILTRGALSEMRTLLFELRPTVLGEMDLEDLIGHLGNAFTGRTGIPVKLSINNQMDPGPDIKEAYYRVTQEALNNIEKHADASQVSINLTSDGQHLRIAICDNGCGFDIQQRSPENFGIGIMNERAAAIGAKLEIRSQLGDGTCLELLWQEEDQ
jgi:signal transduction histidine kinase